MTYPVRGFTLIELSIVLVIIGLIVGGILVGQNLIGAAGVRATITQIEKYNQAVNTFRGEYGYLPGDIKDPDASSFGFAARGTGPGQGDGNGIIQGYYVPTKTAVGNQQACGETVLFWQDLAVAHLIDGSFTVATPASPPALISGTTLNNYFPQAKIGRGNFVYTWSDFTLVSPWLTTGVNYFGISSLTNVGSILLGVMNASPGLSVQEAYSIDTKVDDGLPQSGNVVRSRTRRPTGTIIAPPIP